jgi:hypothetical protein
MESITELKTEERRKLISTAVMAGFQQRNYLSSDKKIHVWLPSTKALFGHRSKQGFI